MKLATISAYALPDGMTIEMASQRNGAVKWVVRNSVGCLNRDGEFEYEPMPSSRDDDFLARCRFDTPEEAYQVWESAERPENGPLCS